MHPVDFWVIYTFTPQKNDIFLIIIFLFSNKYIRGSLKQDKFTLEAKLLDTKSNKLKQVG